MNTDNPFALFAGDTYYPAPGFRSHIGQFPTAEAAATAGRECTDNLQWWQVVDLRTLQIVDGEGAGYTGLFGKTPAGIR